MTMTDVTAIPLMEAAPNPDPDSLLYPEEPNTAACPPAEPRLCDNEDSSNPGNLKKRCGNCFVA